MTEEKSMNCKITHERKGGEIGSVKEVPTEAPEGMVCENGVCKMPEKMTFEKFMEG